MNTRRRKWLTLATMALLLSVGALATSARADVIDFESLPAGAIPDQVFGVSGAGPIEVFGFNPIFPDDNAAMIFDSSNPTGNDADLGSPNEDFGGPGRGDAGEAGQPFENSVALGKVIIVSEDLDQGDPDDENIVGVFIDFDFSALGTVSIDAMTYIDVEDDESVGELVLCYDENDNEISSTPIVATGDNGVNTIQIGTQGVARMRVLLNGSGAVDQIVFNGSGPLCGDGNVDPGESCDPPGSFPDPNYPGNECRSDCTYCGDGEVNGSEECDPADPNAPMGCTDSCIIEPVCGDGNVDPGESCDPPGSFPDPNYPGNECRDDCTYCGDGEVNGNEECDPADPNAPMGCTDSCIIEPVCGDGNVDPGESCDPPGSFPDPNYPGNECRGDCTYCGDGEVNGNEECDPADPNAPIGCTDSCIIEPVCGDGEVNTDEETCDPPGSTPDGSFPDNLCRRDCTYCGDGEVNGAEECDFNDPDAPEGCSDTCLIPVCGDGEVNTPDESCDPPGSTPDSDFPDNLCRDDCTYCGDGEVNGSEECDFNDPDAPADCADSCTIEECDVRITKTCEVVPAPPGPEVSTCSDLKPVTNLTLIWDGPSGVNISVDGGESIAGIQNGDIVMISTPEKDTVLAITGAVSGESKFHVSCSDDEMNGIEDCGNAAGDGKDDDGKLINDWIFAGMAGEEGSFLCPDAIPDPEGFPTETEECSFTPQLPSADCDAVKDLTSLTMEWDGAGPIDMTTANGETFLDIEPGDVVTFDVTNGDNDFEVYISGAVNGQSEFHLSCSDDDMDGPEDCGSNQGNNKSDDASLINDWIFGGMAGENGSFSCPGFPGGSDTAEVRYGFLVENLSDVDLDVVVDDPFIGFMEEVTISGEDSVELVSDVVMITPDDSDLFVNTASATGTTPAGRICSAEDSVTVRRNPPPPSPIECGDIKDITALSMIWNGPDGVDVVTEAGEEFLDLQNGNRITFLEAGTGNDVDLTIIGAVNGQSTFHVSCSDEEMNGTDDCGKPQGNGKDDDSGLLNLWLLDGMTGENGFFDCGLENTGVVDPQPTFLVGADELDLSDDKKVKWEITNNTFAPASITRVLISWPDGSYEHAMLKKVKFNGDIAKDVNDLTSPTDLPADHPFEDDPNKRRIDPGDTERLEIEFSREFQNKSLRGPEDFEITVEFDNGQVLTIAP